MTTKKILGLDLGTNSIGWALIKQDFENKQGEILGMGSRIIPMSQDILGEFDKGNSISQTAERTGYRSVRRLRERHLLRRERLHRVLNVLGFLPSHYAAQIDFQQRLGKFIAETEPKLAYHNNEFIFTESFEEMLEDFRKNQPALTANNKKIPYDWTIYYLRKKALTEKITREELAWILLNFNQKRGYYQLRGEEGEDTPNKLVEFYSFKVVDVIADEQQKGKSEIWYSLVLDNGWMYRRASKTPLFDWKDKVRDFIVTTDLNDDGTIKTDKEGKEKRSFRAPSENDWTLLKKKTEKEIDNSYKTVGAYIYDTLLQNPSQKIKGKLVRTIERKFYKDELKQILDKQKEFHPELQNDNTLNQCIRELYRNNEAQQFQLSKKEFTHLFVEDIIFYQRPLKSQKSSIGNCSLEYRKYKDKEGVEHTQYLKAIPKSHPYYQEFRLWQWMYNLSVYQIDDDANVTAEFLNTTEDWEKLFDFLNNRKEIEQKPLIKYLLEQKGFKGKLLNQEVEKYRWNYVQDKKYPCNETHTLIANRLDKVENFNPNFLTKEKETQLWHIIYSVTDKTEYEKALKSFAQKNQLDETSFVEAFRKIPPFKSEYGAYSEKAIKKLLPLMRLGKYWKWENINPKSQERILKIITGEYDETIQNRVREKALHLTKESDFQGLQLWLAQYIVYGRHSEASIAGKWNSADDLQEYLKHFRQHSLRNPIVEQVVTETLRVIKDIWIQYGKGAKDFFNEIHIELGREMKNTADDRKEISRQVTENENTNLRIKALLAELVYDSNVKNVRPHSPMQQEILKIYEENSIENIVEKDFSDERLRARGITMDEILKISKTPQPSSSDLKRYKLWLEQKYQSPYTGQIIPLNKLFTPEYEIEHIIPQSRYFDDSLSNKVICESAVNKLKDNQLGLEFIKAHHGEIVELGKEKKVPILEVEAYEKLVKQNYSKNRGKRNKLLLEEIPEKMIERQLNDTRYISKFISGILSNIVRIDEEQAKKIIEEGEILAKKETDSDKATKIRNKAKSEATDDGVNSKNIVPGNGKITTILKQYWGLNDVWNDLILPRFERMNQLTNSSDFTAWNEKHQKFLPTVPIELSKNFNKKRIDHRHHAMDALVIACATRDHINLLNNQSAKSDVKRYDLQHKLRNKESYFNQKEGKQKEKFTDFKKPWKTFTQDARTSLESIIISFKQNLRVINKATNHYEKWVEKDGKMFKTSVKQKGINWAIRKPLHEETFSGKIELPWVKKSAGEFITASRKSLDKSFGIEKIQKITDTGIQKILINYLEKNGNNSEMAFSPDGIEKLNEAIQDYNEGKFHHPILKVRLYEKGKGRFSLGQTGNKNKKYVQGAPNLFFAVFEDEKGKRSFASIPLNEVIERQKQGLSAVELKGSKDFYLSPNDLVYVPTDDELENTANIDFNQLSKEQRNRIYKVVSFSGNQIFFVRHNIATSIANKAEFSTLNKMERSIEGKMIKESCVKIQTDRLGNISKA